MSNEPGDQGGNCVPADRFDASDVAGALEENSNGAAAASIPIVLKNLRLEIESFGIAGLSGRRV
jgi:hypothetical protein